MGSRQEATAAVGFIAAFALGVGFWAAVEHDLWATAVAAGGLTMLAAAPALGGLARTWKVPADDVADRSGELRRSEASRRRLTHVIDQAPTPFITRSAEGDLSAVNRAARRLFGTADRLVDPPAALAEALDGLMEGEVRVVVLGPAPGRAFALSGAQLLQEDGLASLFVLTDIEAELRARETATLKETLDVLSHEIMNSLTPVTSLAQTAAALVADGDTASAGEALATLERRALGLLRFVEGYRALARLPEPVIRPVALRIFLADVARLFGGLEGAVVDLEMDPVPDVLVLLDPDLAAQALLNLLRNAAEAAAPPAEGASPSGGRIRVSVHRTTTDEVSITVADNGPGLAGLDPEVILRPFFTTKAGGAGIGLTLVRQIMRDQGRELVIAAPGLDGRGLSVTLSVPVAPGEPP
jgi:two-component system nitrogen regulation sensor histidine kinase NtrY